MVHSMTLSARKRRIEIIVLKTGRLEQFISGCSKTGCSVCRDSSIRWIKNEMIEREWFISGCFKTLYSVCRDID